MRESDWLAALVRFEQDIHFSTPPPSGASPYVFLQGSAPLLLSAPHSTIHMRNGRTKRADGFTGPFVQLLHRLTGAHALFANHRLASDPNWDKYSPYKSLLKRAVRQHGVRFVIDLHGMSNWHKVGMALGTINGRSCPDEMPLIKQTLDQHGFQTLSIREARNLPGLNWQTVVINHPRFTGGVSNYTVTRYVSDCLHVGAIQLELCSTIRVVFEKDKKSPDQFDGHGAATRAAISALRDAICRLTEIL